MLKISALYFMWNPENCQNPPTCGQDDLVLLMGLDILFLSFGQGLDFGKTWQDKHHLL